jgi:hypothetical protein
MTQRQWQTVLYVGKASGGGAGGYALEPVPIYGATLAELRQAAAAWLRQHRPEVFFGPSGRRADGQTGFQAYRSPGGPAPEWQVQGQVSGPYTLDALIEHFLAHELLPEKGPDYQETMLDSAGDLVLARGRTFLKSSNLSFVNEAVRRGWYAHATEKIREGQHEILIYHLVHPEEGAV